VRQKLEHGVGAANQDCVLDSVLKGFTPLWM